MRLVQNGAGTECFRRRCGVELVEIVLGRRSARHVRALRRAGALSFGVLTGGVLTAMPIEQWSDRIGIAHLANDPHLAENLQTAQEHATAKKGDLVLDFAQVRYLNSSHIARLLKLRKAMISDDKRLVLCALDTQVWSAFLVTGLDKIFEFADSVPSALASLQIARQA